MVTNMGIRAVQLGVEPMEIVCENPKRLKVLIHNKGAETIYILDAQNRTKLEGIPIAAGTKYEDDESTNAIYAVSESTTNELRIQVISKG